MRYLIALFVLVGFTSCTAKESVPLQGQLFIEPSTKIVAFVNIAPGKTTKKKIRIRNGDGLGPLRIDTIALDGDSSFSLEDPPKMPLMLEAGEENGVDLTIVFSPKSKASMKATLRIVTGVPGVNFKVPRREEEVELVYVVEPVRLHWSCGATLDFGLLSLGQAAEKDCVVTNIGRDDVVVEKVAFRTVSHQKSKPNDFKWLSPKLPFVIAAEQKQVIRVRYTPSDLDDGVDQGLFELTLQRKLQGSVPLRLTVRGRTKVPIATLVPVYPSCRNNRDCGEIDYRLSCQFDAAVLENRCQNKDGSSFLKLSITARGEFVRMPFLVRNDGQLPLEVKGLSLVNNVHPGLKILTEKQPFPFLLAPRESRQFYVEYGPYKGRSLKGKLVVDTNITTEVPPMLIEVGSSGCHLVLSPTRLNFSKGQSLKLKLSNVGTRPCGIFDLYLKSRNSKVFSIVTKELKGSSILPRRSEEVAISFSAKDQTPHVDALVLKTSDPDAPVIEVPLVGRLQDGKPCELRVSSRALGFGMARPGEVVTRELRVYNDGVSSCRLTGVQLDAVLKERFVVGGGVFPIDLEADGLLTLSVKYVASGAAETHAGGFVLSSGTQGVADVRVSLLGVTTETCLTVLPGGVSFGDIQRGCSSERRVVTVYKRPVKGCPTSLTLSSASLLPASTGNPNPSKTPFRIASAPTLPLTLVDGHFAAFVVSYQPGSGSVSSGLLSFGVDGVQKRLDVPLLGGGVSGNGVRDDFVQVKKPELDLLWVIDNSSSMVEEQPSLQRELQTFMNWLIRLNIDYRMMVTSTDTSVPNAGCALGAVRVVSAKTPNPAATFLRSAIMGTRGGEKGSGLDAMVRALSSDARSGCNKGFYRDKAGLSVFLISDGEDHGPLPVSYYSSFLSDLKGRLRQDLLAVSAVVGDVPSGCEQAGVGKAESGKRYIDMVGRMGGLHVSICKRPWGLTPMMLPSLQGIGYRVRYALTRVAEEKSLVVRVDGKIVKKDERDGWRYDGLRNEVIFGSSVVPGPGARVRIEYQSRCLQ